MYVYTYAFQFQVLGMGLPMRAPKRSGCLCKAACIAPEIFARRSRGEEHTRLLLDSCPALLCSAALRPPSGNQSRPQALPAFDSPSRRVSRYRPCDNPYAACRDSDRGTSRLCYLLPPSAAPAPIISHIPHPPPPPVLHPDTHRPPTTPKTQPTQNYPHSTTHTTPSV